MNENSRKQEKRLLIMVLTIMAVLVVILFVAVGSLIGEYIDNSRNPQTQKGVGETVTPKLFSGWKNPLAEALTEYERMDYYLQNRLEDADKNESLEALLGTCYDGVWTISENSTACLVKKDGKWGMISETGEVLVPLKYTRFSCIDNTGWVELENNGVFYVFDDKGNTIHQYSDKTAYRMESEEAYLYRTAKAYMSGMEIKFTIPEILENDYYGVEYRNKENGRLLYRAVGGYTEAGLFTYPDETGRAVAIRCDGINNTIYYITEYGCESRIMELPEGVNARWFDFVGDYTWADISLSHGWLKVYVSDAVPGYLMDEYHNYYAFLNVDTLELVPFPDEYQTYFSMYNMGRGDAIAILESTKGGPDDKYAVCKGSEVLTEERYYWVNFGKKYIIAARDEGVDILDYEGNIMNTYWDCNGVFINGRMLVLDGRGLYFIDENFEKCSEYLLSGWGVDSCFTYGVIKDGKYYFLPEITMEELPEQALIGTYTYAVSPPPTQVPIRMEDTSYETVKTENEVCRYLENGYLIRRNDCYGLADFQGNVIIKPIYPNFTYQDEEWICFDDSDDVTHVFDYTGRELYSYVYYQGIMTTEQGQNFERNVFYRKGMKIEFDYNYEDAYYGVHYYNAETGELIFELTDEMLDLNEYPIRDFQISTLPNASGMAVVIAGDGFYNIIYRITKDGYTEEIYRENFVERRKFSFSDHEVWNGENLMNGWLITTVYEERGDLLDYAKEWYQMLYNVNTKECIVLPEEYQNLCGKFYRYSQGYFYGMSGESYEDYNNGETDYLYYAICKGNEKLTEEIYQWIRFDTKYIIAGNNSFSHILDYKGNVLAEYRDVAYPFVDGKTLVCDETGAYYIDENLYKCSDYVLKDVDYCHPDCIKKGDEYYLIQKKDKIK